MKTLPFTKQQARRFLLLKQGLLGAHRFSGKAGVCDFIRQAGCIQYDPIDVCGKNAELVLQSRVAGFTKKMLYNLLYEDRALIDYFDKNMAILPMENWPYFSRTRAHYRTGIACRSDIREATDLIIRTIREKGCVCSADIDLPRIVDWSWSPTRLSRAALEALYFSGDLVVHHKKGTVKYYALTGDHIDAALLDAPDPNETDEEFLRWQILRRIGAVGMLGIGPSDAWLGIRGLTGEARKRIFASLLAEGRISACKTEGVPNELFFLTEDEALAETATSSQEYPARLEFIAPLDNMLWDRNLIRTLFDFDYKWEIYTPVSARKYGYYVLPVLYGENFVGRIECVADKKARVLEVRNFWYEGAAWLDSEFSKTLKSRLVAFAEFNGCDDIHIDDM